MKSKKRGKNTLKAEVQGVMPTGIWLLVRDKEYFLDYVHFPWFKKAPANKVFDVKLIHDRHLHWRALDVDLELESLRNKDKYPLIYA